MDPFDVDVESSEGEGEDERRDDRIVDPAHSADAEEFMPLARELISLCSVFS